ncbi:unextended protein isoform X1 [Musca domestica]|uniref:Unextended protein isoform X1 n=3 Tax=Musca domestica TaxID=7370 RepID=A0A1I8NKL3_MUSDO|nr:unextended protein isoform X1 [Musca domestica]XP_058984115.1 unextended protein isoform X1 [Musca domestica]XP_058984116.1 unextended protein isoform X1 [Musca domestica]XP_058984117.1 unextended protein isoform X1 [Musca domestica]
MKMEKVKRLPCSENCQRRTRNSNEKYKTNSKSIMLKHNRNVKSIENEKSMGCPRFGGIQINAPSPTNLTISPGISTKNPVNIVISTFSSELSSKNFLRRLCFSPLLVYALIFLVFTSTFSFGSCSVSSAGDSLINQAHTSVEDPTTTTSSTKILNALNNKNINNNPKLNDTHNLLLPKSAESQIRPYSSPLIITGFRLESSKHEVEYDDGIPSVMSESVFTIRIFGLGITENTVIAFTTEVKDAGTYCQFPATLLHKVINGTVTGNTALYEASLPKGKKDFYICAKNDVNAFRDEDVENPIPLLHQCKDSWCIVRSHESLLPLWVSIVIILICLCFSALFSGLNLGLMALDRTELKILRNTGSDKEREYAKKIQPVRDQGNYLLCSILLGNVLVNSTFTILLDGLTSGLIAVVFSTLAIVIFGEITPQAICSRHGLAVGAKTILITKFIMLVTFPLSYPTSKILDVLLGEEIGNVYNRERLKELVKVTTGINDLDKNEVNIISGALELRKKTVADVMTHIDDAFMLPLDATLDFETVSEIMKSGFSRIPVYDGDRKNIITLLYIKDLAFVDPDDNTPLKTLCEFYQNPVHFVFEDYTLDVMFNQFKDGTIGHLAFVHRVNNEGDGDPFYETIGLVTLEDVIEELIQAEIVDETDVFVDNRTKVKRNRNKKQDFTVFAERRENQTIRISPQLTLATYQFLSTSIDAFKKELISEQILRRLLNQDIVHSIKCKGKEKDDPSLFIFQQNKAVDFFVLILEGRVEVTVGKESLLFESGPFTYFGTQALVSNVVVDSPSQMGSLQSLTLDSKVRQTFVPDYSVRAVTDVIYIAIKRNLYLTAKKATLLEKSRKSGAEPSTAEFDDEVEKLLHSIHEDDRPHHIRSNQSIRKGSTAVGSNTASPSFNDFSSQHSRSILAAPNQPISGSNSGDINDAVSLSSLMTSEAAAADFHNAAVRRSSTGDNASHANNCEKVNNNNDVVTTPLLPKTNNSNAK